MSSRLFSDKMTADMSTVFIEQAMQDKWNENSRLVDMDQYRPAIEPNEDDIEYVADVSSKLIFKEMFQDNINDIKQQISTAFIESIKEAEDIDSADIESFKLTDQEAYEIFEAMIDDGGYVYED